MDPGNYDSDSGEPAGAAGPWSARTFKFAMAAGGRAPPVTVICYSEIAIATGPGPGLPAWALGPSRGHPARFSALPVAAQPPDGMRARDLRPKWAR